MGKMINLLLVILAINFVMVIFLDISPPGSSLWLLITNPEQWAGLDLIDYLKDTFVLIGAAAVIVGTLWFKSDFVVFAGITSIFFSFGMSLVELYQYLNSVPYFDESTYIAKLFIGCIFMIYLYTVLSFWRGKD